MVDDRQGDSASLQIGRWYDLFSRGARDWLRHNAKIRETVKRTLPELVTGPDVLTQPGNRTVRVPVRFLEHYRFRLSEPGSRDGAGQGQGVEPGDILRPADPVGGAGAGGAGEGEGGIQFVVEVQINDILDWIWEELRLPNLDPLRSGPLEESEPGWEGWDRRGLRSRLDRRRTMKEAVKRRAIQPEAAPFSNEDLRFRQPVRKPRPVTAAVVVFALDVSSSMDESARKLAKTFFFWALQGIRHTHGRVETAFVAHTVDAWEFAEEEFFAVTATGGTKASSAFALTREILRTRYDPSQYNSYLFYASDGENFTADRDTAVGELKALADVCSLLGYVQTARAGVDVHATEMGRIFRALAGAGASAESYGLADHEDVWEAIRVFFTGEAGRAA